MRRMRDLNWRDYVVVGAAIGVAIGVHAIWRNFLSNRGSNDPSFALKPSDFKDDSSGSRRVGPTRAVAASDSPKIRAALEEFRAHEEGTHGSRRQARLEPPIRPLRKAVGPDNGMIDGECASFELLGDDPERVRISSKQWAAVMKNFHEVKAGLLKWLRDNRGLLLPETANAMEAQVRNLRIQRPPSQEEPDLAWRGIGVWTQDASGAPIVRVGSGLVKMTEKFPERAKFELARLVAQAWAPCELARVGAGQPWDALTQCLGVDDAQGCDIGNYSESGWAVSTTLAHAVAAPGCRLAAFRGEAQAECAKHIPLSSFAAHTKVSPYLLVSPDSELKVQRKVAVEQVIE